MSVSSKFMGTVAALALTAGMAAAQATATVETEAGAATATVTTETDATITADANTWAPGWNEDLDGRYGDIADRQIAELLGMNVLSDTGEDVGEVDTFILVDEQILAVVGVGGFLGLGEHEVAIPLSEMEYNGEALVIAYTEEELRAMPQYMNEFDQAALGADDTFRTRGMEIDADAEMTAEIDPGTPEEVSPTGEEVAAAEAANEAAGGDGDTMVEEVAEAEQGAIEQEAEEIVAEADAALENAGEAVADAADATGEAIQDGAEATQQMAENAADATGDWFQKLETEFAEIADWEINELEGRDVATMNGEIVGEIDQMAVQNDDVVALVGIGGFIGLGEHDVAIELSQLSWDGEKFIVNGMTEEELKAMPEYDASTVVEIEDDVTLRAQAQM